MVESTKSFDTCFRARPELLCECLNVTLRSFKLHIAGAKHLTRFAYTRALYDVAAFRSLRLESGSLSAWGKCEDGGVEWERSNLHISSKVTLALKNTKLEGSSHCLWWNTPTVLKDDVLLFQYLYNIYIYFFTFPVKYPETTPMQSYIVWIPIEMNWCCLQ